MKLTILGGFLGAGKTTWLRHQLHRGAYKDSFVIVNEAAEVPVDDILLGGLLGGSSDIAVLAGGCACCDTLDRLVLLLRELCDRRVRGDGSGLRPAGVVLETSGLADPGRIVEAIRRDPVLVHHLVIDATVVVVDATYGLGQIKSEPLGRSQVEVADRLVVTKIDAADGDELQRLLATVRRLNPAAEISGATNGETAALPAFEEADAEVLPDLSGGTALTPVATKLSVEGIDWTAFSVWLSALLHARGNDVMRVKGVVRTPAGRLLLQSVRRAVQSPEILPDDAKADDDTLVFIGRGYAADDLARSLRLFADV
jgi:G3E family GTPase